MNYEIPWRPVRDIPNQPGYRLTVKSVTGDLINTTVLRGGQLDRITTAEIKGWIPNEQ